MARFKVFEPSPSSGLHAPPHVPIYNGLIVGFCLLTLLHGLLAPRVMRRRIGHHVRSPRLQWRYRRTVTRPAFQFRFAFHFLPPEAAKKVLRRKHSKLETRRRSVNLSRGQKCPHYYTRKISFLGDRHPAHKKSGPHCQSVSFSLSCTKPIQGH